MINLARRKRSGSRRRSGGRRPKRRRSGGRKKMSIAITAGALASAATIATKAPTYKAYLQGMQFQPNTTYKSSPVNAAKGVVSNMADPVVYIPLAGGIVISMLGSKLGVNKYVSKVPVIGKKVRL